MTASASVDQQLPAAGFDQIRVEHRAQQILAGRQFGERRSAGLVNIHHHCDGQIVKTVIKRCDADIAKPANALAFYHQAPAGQFKCCRAP
jgi:hypothetical protein